MQNNIRSYLSRFQFLVTLTILLLLPLILSASFTRPYLDSKRAFLNFIVPLGIGAFLCSLLLSRDPWKKARYLLLPLLYSFLILVSALFSANISLSLFTTTQQFLLICGGFWLGFSMFGDSRQRGKIILTISVVGLFVCIHSFFQFIGYDFLYGFFPWKIVEDDLIHFRHIPGTLGNPDYVGGFVMMVSFWMLVGYSYFHNKTVFIPLFLFAVIMTLITQTRSALFGLAGGLLFLFIYFRKIPNLRFKKNLLIISGVSIGVFVVALFLVSWLFTDYMDFFIQRMHNAIMLLESSFKVRLLHWQLTTEMFQDNWLWGISPGMYRISYMEYLLAFAASPEAEPFENVLRMSGGRLAGEAHNDFFQIFAEYGVLAGAMFIFILTCYFVSAAKTYTENFSRNYILLIFTAFMVATLIHAFFSFPFQLYVRAFYVWFTLGAGFSLIYNHKRSVNT